MAKDVKAVKWAKRALSGARRKVEDLMVSLHFVASNDMLAWSAEKNAKSGAF